MTDGGSIRIREATLADADSLAPLRLALWPEDSEAQHLEEARACLAGRSPFEAWTTLLAEEDDHAGGLLGFAELSVRPWAEGCTSDRVAYLEGWYVLPRARRRGVGKALIEAAEDWARARRCTEFASDADADNLLGFDAHLGVGFTDAGLVRAFRKDVPAARDARDS